MSNVGLRLAGVLAALGVLLPAVFAFADSWDDWRSAVYNGQEAEVVRMLDAGVDIDTQNDEGWTALHVAAEQGEERMVALLLSRGARTDLKTGTGRTAYDVALGHQAVRALIRGKMGGPPIASAARAAAPAPAPNAASASKSTAAAKPSSDPNRVQCQQKYRADTALCSDETCKMTAMRHWQQCLKTGRYW